MDVLSSAWQYMENFDGDPLIDWMDNHTEVPVFAITAYLIIIFKVPELLQDGNPIALRAPFALWNFILASFSIVGACFTVPKLAMSIYEHGYRYTVCEDPRANYYFHGACGFWTAAFILSKIPELIDTVFLVLQKKPVIFLHWFHHITVLLYCWHSYRLRMSNGLWFAAMNFGVHSIMYTYYFFMAINMRKLVKPIAPMITSLQLAQMVMGMVVTISTWYWTVPGDLKACHANTSNIKMGLAMYGSYFVLFAMLFRKLYLSPKRSQKGGKGGAGDSSPTKRKAEEEDDICAVAGLSVNKVDDVQPLSGKKSQ